MYFKTYSKQIFENPHIKKLFILSTRILSLQIVVFAPQTPKNFQKTCENLKKLVNFFDILFKFSKIGKN